MKKLVLALAFFVLSTSPAFCEELPDGFYEMEVVKNAIQEQVASLREFTPAQLEVVYQASKILHDEYFGAASSPEIIVDRRLPQGEYLIGEFIPAGNYIFSLGDSDMAVLWVDKPNQLSHNYYSMSDTTDRTEVILRLEEGWLLRVTLSNVYISTMTGF